MIRDHSDYGRSNELVNPCPEWTHRSRITDPDLDHPKGTHPKFSAFSWERILILKSACVNMVMQIQVQIGDTRRVLFYESAFEC